MEILEVAEIAHQRVNASGIVRPGVAHEADALPIRPHYLAFGTPDYTEAEIEAVAQVMRSGWVGQGQETQAFEAELQAHFGVPEVVLVNSCTSALFLSLRECGVGAGDEVIVPSLTWCSSANAALYLDASPVFCDIEPESLCLSTQDVMKCLTPSTRAVVVVHYGGRAVDVKALRAALPDHVAIVEDAAHALGARYPDGTAVGTAGNLTCFSFYANKNLATADGGAIALHDSAQAQHLRSLRMHGMQSHAWSRYIKPASLAPVIIEELGFKMNYCDLQAAIGRVQLRRFDGMQAQRHRLALHYQDHLNTVLPDLPFQAGCFDNGHARHLLVGLFDSRLVGRDRDALLQELRARHIGASIHYAPLHRMPLYTNFPKRELPVTDALAPLLLTLPISARMTLKDVDYVCDHLVDIVSSPA